MYSTLFGPDIRWLCILGNGGSVGWNLGISFPVVSDYSLQSCRKCGRRCATASLMKSSFSICNAFPVSLSPKITFLVPKSTIITTTPISNSLTIRLLESRSRTDTTKLLRFTPSVVGNEEGSVVLHECLLQLVLGELIHIFLVVCDDRLGNGLSDGVDLRSVATAGDAHSNVNLGEFVEADDEKGFVDLRVLLGFARWCWA